MQCVSVGGQERQAVPVLMAHAWNAHTLVVCIVGTIRSYPILSYTGGQTDNAKFITCNAAKAQPACSDISMGWIRYGEEVEEEKEECWVWRADHLSILLNFSLFTHNRK